MRRGEKVDEYVNLCNIMALDPMRIADGGAYSDRSEQIQLVISDATRTLYLDVTFSGPTCPLLSIAGLLEALKVPESRRAAGTENEGRSRAQTTARIRIFHIKSRP